MTADGRTLVFARYEEWGEKDPYIATRSEDEWTVRQLTELGTVYNFAISPDGLSIVTSAADDGQLTLYSRTKDGWALRQNLSAAFAVTGSYPQITSTEELVFYDPDGASGAGIYSIDLRGAHEQRPKTLFVPEKGVAFDAFISERGPMFVTVCTTDSCRRSDGNGVFKIAKDGSQSIVEALDYVWGFQPVEAAGISLFTDGDDILFSSKLY
ncbi:MAG: hypothetical protein AAGC56_03355 [Pseudomonadota bacterium]